MTTERTFIQTEIAKSLEKLSENSPAKFGIMTPQHMVEHISALFYLGRKEIGLTCITPDEKLDQVRNFLYSNEPFWKNFKAPGVPEDKLMDLRFSSLDEAKGRLLSSVDAFYSFYAENPQAEILHPVFGRIGFEAWERFQYKHCIHHLQQFGALSAAYPVEAKKR